MDALFLYSNDEIKNIIGKKIKNYRIDLGYSQKDLAKRSGISIHSISNIENGNGVTLDNLINIMRALNILNNIDNLVPDVASNPFDIDIGITNRQRVRKK